MAPVRLSLFLALSACTLYTRDEPRPATANDQPKETLAAMAGEYYHGDGLGMNMRLAIMPEGRFSFTWRGCLGLYGADEGKAKLINGHLILKPENPDKGDQYGNATDYILVR
jgi:hypothetical protein